MAKYADEKQARADGFSIAHEPERHRFALLQAAEGAADKVVGEAHYTLIGDDAIDFDHTVVDPGLRGTGLSGLLAERALTDEIVRGRKIHASCWYIEGYLERNPHLVSPQA
jgi:predicted GNAT family acetyltransferase